MLQFITLLCFITTLTTLNACTFNLPGTSIRKWPSTNDILTDATPLPFYKRSLSCTSQKWSLQKLMRNNKISIPTCLATINRKCRSTSSSSYAVCLSDFCGGMSPQDKKTDSGNSLNSMTTKVQTTVNQSQSLANNLKDENWMTIILFFSSIISIATLFALICKTNKQNPQKSKEKTESSIHSFGLYPKIPKILQNKVTEHA